MAWFSGKVSLGNLDFAGAVNKLSVSVKNIKKNFDNVLGLKEKSDDAAASDTEDMSYDSIGSGSNTLPVNKGNKGDAPPPSVLDPELTLWSNVCRIMVKVPVWIDGKEVAEYVGVGARFGKSLESNEKHANQTRVSLADPPDCCSKPRNKLSGEIILVHRGNCSFVTKGNVAEDAGASALLII